jgi:transketolase
MQKLDKNEIKELKNLCCRVRQQVVQMIANAKSGHPGGSLSATDILTVLYNKILKTCPKWKEDPSFADRDRFVLSKGHASATLYAVLAECGYFDKEELMSFRKLHSRLQGHPSNRLLPGVEVSTGSLGQGLSMACGMALGLKLDKKDARVYALLGDGEMQEGQIWEALMSAAHRKLDNLTVIVDRNRLQIDGDTDEVKSLGSLRKKLLAFGFEVIEIDGHNVEQIYEALQKAKELSQEHKKPSAIIANTVKGRGVWFMENCACWHGVAPNSEECEKALEELRSKEIC